MSNDLPPEMYKGESWDAYFASSLPALAQSHPALLVRQIAQRCLDAEASALAPSAAQSAAPQGAPVAWRFVCKRPGRTVEFASLDGVGGEASPFDQWRSLHRIPLADAGPPELVWEKCGELSARTPTADLRLAAAERVAKALETDLAEYDPEDFGCACEPGHTCGPCRERNRQKPLRAALSEYRSTK